MVHRLYQGMGKNESKRGDIHFSSKKPLQKLLDAIKKTCNLKKFDPSNFCLFIINLCKTYCIFISKLCSFTKISWLLYSFNYYIPWSSINEGSSIFVSSCLFKNSKLYLVILLTNFVHLNSNKSDFYPKYLINDIYLFFLNIWNCSVMSMFSTCSFQYYNLIPLRWLYNFSRHSNV